MIIFKGKKYYYLKRWKMGENISIIGRVFNKIITKNKNILFEIGDSARKMVAFIACNKVPLYKQAEGISNDEIIEVKGKGNKEIIFANEIAIL
jgi:DNA polymerase II small subunit/DNA polymerase delta subunit B